jgi:hypothetical protein
MRTQFYVPGPSQLYVGDVSNSGALNYLFLGYCDGPVEVSLVGLMQDVNADYAGQMPADVQFMGEVAFINGTLSRYNEEVLQNMMVRAGTLDYQSQVANDTGLPYMTSWGVVGSLMVWEGWAFPFVIKCPYAIKTSQSPRIPLGYTFYQTFLHENFMMPLSSRVKQPRFIMRAIPVHNECEMANGLYGPNIPDNLPICLLK